MANPDKICSLCKSREADKKGSHIIPAFMVSSAFNLNGTGDRDKELFVTMSGQSFTKSFFGRSLNPEAIEKFKGRALTDEEIEGNKNPIVKDFIFCSHCEKRLSVIEGFFSEEIYKRLMDGKLPLAASKNSYKVASVDNPNALLCILFLISIVWRVSMFCRYPMKLESKLEEQLRVLLDDLLDLDFEKMKANCNADADRLTKYPMILLFSEREDESTRNLVYGDSYRTPYFLIANQFVIEFYHKGKHLRSPINGFFGLSQLINLKEAVNYQSSTFNIIQLSHDQTEAYRHEVLKGMVAIYRKEIRLLFGKVFERIFGQRPDDKLVYAITYKIVHDKIALGEKFTFENIGNQIVDFIYEHQDDIRRYLGI